MTANIARWQDTRGFMVGAGIGAQILTVVGGAWALTPLALQHAPAWIIAVVVGIVFALTAFGATRLLAVSKRPSKPRSASESAESARAGRRMGVAFGLVFAVEFGLIAISSTLLGQTHRAPLIPIAVAFIVGVHFIPLARIFRIPTYGYGGTLMALAALASLLVSDEQARLMSLGLVSALILWATAGAVLFVYTGRRTMPALIG